MADAKIKSIVDDRLERAIEICRSVKGDEFVDYAVALRFFEPSYEARHDLTRDVLSEIYKRRTPCWIYFARIIDHDAVKIGRSTKVAARLATLTKQSGIEHTLIGTIKGDYREEWFAQQRYRPHRVTTAWGSREYFRLSPIEADISALLSQGSIPLEAVRHHGS